MRVVAPISTPQSARPAPGFLVEADVLPVRTDTSTIANDEKETP
jgi:hypothetical protein